MSKVNCRRVGETVLATFQIHCLYACDGQQKKLLFTDFVENDDLSMVWQVEAHEGHEAGCLSIHPKRPVVLQQLFMTKAHHYGSDDRIFVNGYQSWTDSREFGLREKLRGISPLAKPVLKTYHFDKYGDYTFKKYPKRKGVFHGYTYGYIRSHRHFQLLGSLSEDTGFTEIGYDAPHRTVTVRKECSELSLSKVQALMTLFFSEGSADQVFDTYFETMGILAPTAAPMNGWTSWYNYYQAIDESLLRDNLSALAQAGKAIDLFQIDDGYQTAIGDWLSVDYMKFPRGLKTLAAEIKSRGFKSGLWLAPFICEKASQLFVEKPHWLQRDSNGELVVGGSNWSSFYALDIDHPEVRDYLKTVFKTVLEDWGFDLVKLDFLYAACLVPKPHKTRGQIMSEGMTFLRECVGDKLILACGVPLGSAFGKVDYCRIGCDVGLDWDDKAYMKLFHRERVSTLHALESTIGRRHLDGRAFLNDPDVFLLRYENMKLTEIQKRTLATINCLFGSLKMTSDDIRLYDASQNKQFDAYLSDGKATINHVEVFGHGLVSVEFTLEGRQSTGFFNLSGRSGVITDSGHPDQSTADKSSVISLAPYDCLILRR